MTDVQRADDRDLVLITGTSGGLGSAIAKHLIGLGYRIVGVARRDVTAGDLGVDSSSYSHIEFDLGSIDRISELMSGIVDAHGKPYGLINNAAIGTDGLLPTMHNRDIEQLIAVNVTAPIVLAKYVVRQMISARRGRVVNVSSIIARTGYRGLAVYGATKAAMEGFTRSLARDVGPRGVTINAVAPGFLETEMTSALGDANLKRIESRSALGRFAAVDEVAGAVAYLLSEAGAGITGTTVTVDAGSTA